VGAAAKLTTRYTQKKSTFDVSRLGLPVSHSGQNVIQLKRAQKSKKEKGTSISAIFCRRRLGYKGKKSDVPAVELGRAKHDDPVMPRGVAPHDLVHDQRGERPRAEHREQLERDDRRVCGAPTRIRGDVFAPCHFALCTANEKRSKIRRTNNRLTAREKAVGNVHISAKGPADVLTVRPNVDSAMKEPSMIKWMSASKVWLWLFHVYYFCSVAAARVVAFVAWFAWFFYVSHRISCRVVSCRVVSCRDERGYASASTKKHQFLAFGFEGG
jgi:hypothetical protein